MAGAAIAIAGLRYAWPGTHEAVLDLPALDIAASDQVFVQGASGCGKSTFLGLVAGVLVAGRGQVRVAGVDWAGLAPSERDARRAATLGVIFQQFNLLPYLSVVDNVLLPCRLSASRAGRCEGGMLAQARRLLARMGLPEPAWTRPAARLSVGQQQRVAAARALIGGPDLVLADEPTSALDSDTRDRFMALLREQCTAVGSTLVFVSHDRRLAQGFDRVVDLPALNRVAPTAAEVA
ncbi:MAG: ABC transporter ATP-binding protein [Rubrivivax sp.]|jgi:putative ABC transport system ATP-binding protein|nr:ABC transporter ATP-binding protein [Rubrivivax sp.]